MVGCSRHESWRPMLICIASRPIQTAADQSRMMQEQMTMQAGGMPQDPKQAFKTEWEALEVTEHTWALRNAETEMLQLIGDPKDS